MLVLIELVYIYIPSLIPNTETPVFLTKLLQLSYESCTTDRKVIDRAREIQIDISSASFINSPLYLIAAHQKTQTLDPDNATNNVLNNRFNNAMFDHVKVRKFSSEIDGVCCPKNPIMVIFDENSNLYMFRDQK